MLFLQDSIGLKNSHSAFRNAYYLCESLGKFYVLENIQVAASPTRRYSILKDGVLSGSHDFS